MPEDHALTRSFYLLQDFPGRWTGRHGLGRPGPIRTSTTASSSVIIGGQRLGRRLGGRRSRRRRRTPVLPGGERQRELARRFGVNVVMYALTGNYKTDQVHVPALLERLGQ